MSLLRLIARLDIKGPSVVKGVQFEGLRVVGKPADLARQYAEAGADELLYIDTVATLYGRNNLAAVLERTVEDVFVPITVGGGISDFATCRALLNSGADKLAINTAAVRNPRLVAELADRLGSQCIVVSIEAKRTAGGWEAFTDNGRERTHKDAVAWAAEAVELGAGEILITSIDQDGTRKGFDLPLISALKGLPVPVTASGGMGCLAHLKQAIGAGADAVAMASVLHYGKTTFDAMRDSLKVPA